VTPLDAPRLLMELAHQAACGLVRVVPTLAAGLIQAATEGASAAAGMTADAAAARPEVVMGRLRFLSLAYTMVWVILAAYIALLSLRQRRLERMLRRLRERLGA
jgi:CcmD family protein